MYFRSLPFLRPGEKRAVRVVAPARRPCHFAHYFLSSGVDLTMPSHLLPPRCPRIGAPCRRSSRRWSASQLTPSASSRSRTLRLRAVLHYPRPGINLKRDRDHRASAAATSANGAAGSRGVPVEPAAIDGRRWPRGGRVGGAAREGVVSDAETPDFADEKKRSEPALRGVERSPRHDV
jgi:hypothetical protein